MNAENSVFAIYPSQTQLEDAVDELVASGFAADHIAVLHPRNRTRESSPQEKERIYRTGLIKAVTPIFRSTALWDFATRWKGRYKVLFMTPSLRWGCHQNGATTAWSVTNS